MRHKIAPAHHAKLKRSSGVKNFFKILATVLVITLLSVVAVGAYVLYTFNNRIVEKSVDLTPEKPDTVEAKLPDSIEGKFSMLIVGSDTREGQQYNDGEESDLADVTMLVNVNESHTRLDVVSFPRDLMVPFPSCVDKTGAETYPESSRQINSALTVGGLPCVANVVSSLTGQEIPYAALVNFDSVIDMTEAIDGVPVCIASDIYNADNGDLIFSAGEHNLKGWDALTFLRERKGVGDGGDLGRINNQQVFMKSFINKVLKDGTLYNPVKVYNLANIAVDNLTLSSNLTDVNTLSSLATLLTEIPKENIQFHTVPNYEHPYDQNRLLIDEASMIELFASFESAPVPTEPVTDDTASDSSTGSESATETGTSDASGVTEKPEETKEQPLQVSCASGG